MTTETKTADASARIRDLVRIAITGQDEVSLSRMTDSIVTLLSEDGAFIKAFAIERLRASVYSQVQQQVASSRMTTLGDDAVTPDGMAKRVERFSQRFLNWYEHSGDRHVRVMDMTREDLLSAAIERRQRGDHELRIASLWTRMADQLEGGQRVQDRFTAEQLDGMYAEIATEGANN